MLSTHSHPKTIQTNAIYHNLRQQFTGSLRNTTTIGGGGVGFRPASSESANSNAKALAEAREKFEENEQSQTTQNTSNLVTATLVGDKALDKFAETKEKIKDKLLPSSEAEQQGRGRNAGPGRLGGLHDPGDGTAETLARESPFGDAHEIIVNSRINEGRIASGEAFRDALSRFHVNADIAEQTANRALGGAIPTTQSTSVVAATGDATADVGLDAGLGSLAMDAALV